GGWALDRELRTIRFLLEELSQTRKPKDRAFAILRAAGIEGPLASALAAGATRAARDPEGGGLTAFLRRRIAERLDIRPSPIDLAGPRVIACIGPTGVGKTTTLAKLAAKAHLELGRSVSVITLDTFRVG